MSEKDAIFTLDGKVSIAKAFPVSMQHVFAMVIGNIAPAIIVAGALGMGIEQKSLLIQMSMLTAGISTLVQVYGIGVFGSRLPVIMGLNFAFVPIVIVIGKSYSIADIFGANIIGGAVIILFGASIMKIRKFFPHLVTGTTVLTMGISLYPVAISYMAGGDGAVDFGAWKHWLVSLITLAVVYLISEFGKGYFKLMAILIGLIIGYVLAISLGMVDFNGISQAGYFSIPKILPMGLNFNLGACVTMVIMYIVTSVEVIGDISSLTMGGMDRDATSKELSTGIMGKGIAAVFTSFIGGLPTATFSQNVGIVSMTKAINKKIIKIAGIIIVITGFLPKFGAIMSTIPNAVLGGATLSVFAIISINGIKIIAKEPFTMRNCSILGVALTIGVGISQVPQALDKAPVFFKTFFASSPVIMATLIVFILNLLIPEKSFEQEEKERELKK